MKRTLFFIPCFLAIIAMTIGVAIAANEPFEFSGQLLGSNEKPIKNGLVVVTMNGIEKKEATNSEGKFSMILPNTGPFDVTYSADGFIPLSEKTVTIESKDVLKIKNKDLMKQYIQRESVGGWWIVLLSLPGLFGLFVAWGAEWLRKKYPAESLVTYHRLVVSLLNGLIWGVVLACIWCFFAEPAGVTKIWLFNPEFTFEFYVPMLGLFGALLFVFDLLRSKDDDFKGKEFGMRIIMAPYVAIVMVSLFGKDMGFIDIGSHTGQGTLAFFSGLLVVVALQGLIERANEFLGDWRRGSGYHPSQIAKKFELTEEEDLMFRKITITRPEQLLDRDVDSIKASAKEVGIDEYMIGIMIKELEREQLYSKVGSNVWKRLKALEVTNLKEYANLGDDPIRQMANNVPTMCENRLIELRNRAQQLYTANGQG